MPILFAICYAKGRVASVGICRVVMDAVIIFDQYF